MTELIDVMSAIEKRYAPKTESKPPKVDKRKYKGKRFINIRSETYGIETIDEFDTLKEAREMLSEYRLVYRNNPVEMWISQRPDNTWYGDGDGSN